MELVDLVDERGAVVEVVTRAEMRSRGAAVRHRAVYVAVITSGGALVVHQRADWIGWRRGLGRRGKLVPGLRRE